MNRSICVIGILLAIVILLAAQILAVDPNGAQIYSETNKGRFPTPGPSNIDIQAGNITRVALVSNMTTLRWTGLYGNASGSLKLGDSGGIVMYSWAAQGNLVYLSQTTPTWATLADASAANVDAVYTFVGGSAADNYTNTFSNAPENIGSNIFTLTSDYATTLSGAATTWKTYSLTDGSNIVFTGKVSHSGTAYDGEAVDYQMIIPEDGTGGNEAPTNWRIFIELV
jgi:hypothetical protein